MMNDANSFVSTSALRFDGYRYEGFTGNALADLAREIEASLTLYEDDFKNFAAFFALQRFLGKWGGEMTLSTSRVRKAFWLLFFHLVERQTPSAYAWPEYQHHWETTYFPQRQHYLAPLRKSWKHFIEFEENLIKDGTSLTSSGALLMPDGHGWPAKGRWCFIQFFGSGGPVVFPAKGDDYEQGMQEKRNLTDAELSEIKTRPELISIRRYFEFLNGEDYVEGEEPYATSNPIEVPERFTLELLRWYSMEFISDEYGSEARSYLPIRVTSVRPLHTGKRTLRLAFQLAFDTEETVYQVRTIERARHFLLMEVLDDPRHGFILLREISWEWLASHFGLSRQSECADVAEWLDMRLQKQLQGKLAQ